MNRMTGTNAAQAYKEIGTRSSVEAADPYRLVQMLMEGVLDRVARARGHIERGETMDKGREIGRAMDILATLRTSLDPAAGEDLVARLEQLYDYMERQLYWANRHNQLELLDEVARLMKQIKSAWDEIPPETRSVSQAQAVDPAEAEAEP